VFQNFGIFRDMTLAENVLVAFEALSAEERAKLGDLHEAVTDTLRLVGLHHHPQQRASSLSGGQMRLLEIARTLRSRKTCVLLDEPTAGVSPKMTGQVADLILQLKAEGKTVMIVEHDLPFISRICDRVVVLNEGRVFLQGTPRELEHNAQLRELYFGTLPAHT
jgi:branched-chain amino acid transport system ATP-binding protein